jgi:hypothetical protein
LDDDRELDHLLSRGGLGGPQRDIILERVLASTAAERPRFRWRNLLLAGLAVGSVTAGALVMIRPADQGFRARGTELGASIDVACVGSTLAACPQGATLLFALSGASAGGYLGAYAIAPDGSRIWYFSGEVEAPSIPLSDRTRAFTRGIRVGPEHRPGRYVVHVLLTRRPHSRERLAAPEPDRAARDPDLMARQTFDLTVVAP